MERRGEEGGGRRGEGGREGEVIHVHVGVTFEEEWSPEKLDVCVLQLQGTWYMAQEQVRCIN